MYYFTFCTCNPFPTHTHSIGHPWHCLWCRVHTIAQHCAMDGSGVRSKGLNTTQEQIQTSVERSTHTTVTNQLATPPTKLGSVRNVLVSQPLSGPATLDPSVVDILQDQTGLMQSSFALDTSGCDPSGASNNPPPTSEAGVSTVTGNSSSIINSASVATSIPSSTGPCLEGMRSSSKVASGGNLQGLVTENLIDQISAPLVLPDLNLAMDEELMKEKTEEVMVGGESGAKSLKPLNTGGKTAVDNAAAGKALRSVSNPRAAISVSPSFSSSATLTPQTATVAATHTTAVQTTGVAAKSSVSVVPSSKSSTRSTVLPSVPPPASSVSTLPASQGVLSRPSTAGTLASSFPPPSSITPLPSSSTRPTTSTLTSVASLTPGLSASQSVTSVAASMLAKGLNLPLLQFLHLNFPSLKIKDIQDVLSINTLLTQVLKQQINPGAMATTQATDTSKTGLPSPSLKGVVPSSTSTSGPTQLNVPGTKASGARLTLSKLSMPFGTAPAVGSSPRLATQSGLLVPTTRATTTLSKTVMSQPTSSLRTPPMMPTASSGVKAMPARPLPVGGQPQNTSLGIAQSLLSKQNPSLLSTLAAPAGIPPSTVSSTSTAANNRKVLVQILNKTGSDQSTTSQAVSSPSAASTHVTTTTPSRAPIMVPQTKPLSKSPLILNRHGRLPSQVVRTTLASLPSPGATGEQASPSTSSSAGKHSTPISSLCVSLSLPALRKSPQVVRNKRKSLNPRKSTHHSSSSQGLVLGQQLSRTVVQPAESEAMEVDVGQPIQKLELPKHLKDHSYSLYNPEEGEKQRLSSRSTVPTSVCSIPPARLSYAPQVPDSPSTLHKLLKVLPKKNSRSHPATPPPHSSSSRTPGSRSGKTRGGGKKIGGRGVGKFQGRGSFTKKIALASVGSEEESRASSSDLSDSEEKSKKVCIKCSCSCMYTCMHVHVHVYAFVHVHVYIRTLCLCVCKYLQKYMYIHVQFIHVHMNFVIFVYTLYIRTSLT